MDRKPPRKLNHERIIYITVDFAIDILKNVTRGLLGELDKKIDSYSANSKNEINENAKDLIVRIYLPGIKKEDINVDLSQKRLELSYIGPRGRNKKIKNIKLPKSVVVEESTADLEDDILTVKMPKEVKKIKYEVK